MILRILTLLCLLNTPAAAQNLAGLARVLPDESTISKTWGGETRVQIALSQGVPYKVTHLGDPNRIVVDFQVLVFEGLIEDDFLNSDQLRGVHFGPISSSLSRMVLHLNEPMSPRSVVLEAGMDGEPAQFEMVLSAISQEGFDAQAVVGNVETVTHPAPVAAKQRPTGDQKWMVAIDPGHGGIDPGADGGRRSEADLMLLTGFELQDRLRRSGRFDVVMTRTDDSFVGLEERMSLARAAGADVFLSLHADAVIEGVAFGSTVYVLSEQAGSEADAKLAARHNNSDILAGVNLAGQGDEIAQVLMEMVRRETAPRTDALATALIAGLAEIGMPINSKPLRYGDFAVLRSADIPSVLIELGFLSSESDRLRLNDPVGRGQLVDGITQALLAWTIEDTAGAALIRQ